LLPNIFWAKPEGYRKATQRIHHAPGRASFVELPIVTRRQRHGSQGVGVCRPGEPVPVTDGQ
jgi:hypothetical protein